MARVFSGIKPTGDLHLGNLLGAVGRWVDAQPPAGSEEARRGDQIFCVVDLHAMTIPYDAAQLRARTQELATLLLAAGLDSQRCILFVQSHVHEHTELAWILNNVATFGELRRMTQFKDKSQGQDTVTVGLFDYPVLMAADILLYDTEEVPVGEDQRQHVELTRDVAVRFNGRFGDTFVVPEAVLPAVGARVKDLQNPSAKMSKSESAQGTILALDPPEVVAKKVRTAVTDSGSEIRHDPGEKPGVSNLLEIYAAVQQVPLADAEAELAAAGGYGKLKAAVADAVVEFLRPLQARYAELASDPAEVAALLRDGADRARGIAAPVLARARTAAGLLPA